MRIIIRFFMAVLTVFLFRPTEAPANPSPKFGEIIQKVMHDSRQLDSVTVMDIHDGRMAVSVTNRGGVTLEAATLIAPDEGEIYGVMSQGGRILGMIQANSKRQAVEKFIQRYFHRDVKKITFYTIGKEPVAMLNTGYHRSRDVA